MTCCGTLATAAMKVGKEYYTRDSFSILVLEQVHRGLVIAIHIHFGSHPRSGAEAFFFFLGFALKSLQLPTRASRFSATFD